MIAYGGESAGAAAEAVASEPLAAEPAAAEREEQVDPRKIVEFPRSRWVDRGLALGTVLRSEH